MFTASFLSGQPAESRWGILDDLSKKTAGRNATQQKIGDFFAACMDEAGVEKLGSKPLAPYSRKINGYENEEGSTGCTRPAAPQNSR